MALEKGGLSATWVARSFRASPRLYCHWLGALVSIAARFLRINVGFAVPREGTALIRPNGHGLARERARRHTRPNSSDALIVFFLWALQRRSSTAAAAPPCPIVCRVNRETENNPRKGKISTSPPPPAYPPLVVLYLWPKCLGIKSYYFLLNKPVSGRNYTQLGVRSFSVRGLDPFI